jgi:aerobic C4-dicarboxylate transport protein
MSGRRARHECRPSTLDTKGIDKYVGPGKMQTTTDFLINIIPTSVVDAFAKGDMLQVLFFSILFGYAMHAFGERGKPVFELIENCRTCCSVSSA